MAKSMFDGEWVTFRIDNSGIKFEMPDGSVVNDIKKMGDFDSILNRFEKKMQSATGNSSFRFNTGLRFSDTKTGYQYQDVVIRKEDYDTIIKVLEGYEASLDLGTYGDDVPNTYLANSKSEPVRLLNYTRKIEGAKARAKMKKEAYLAGGMANEDFTPKNPERMSATLFVRESEYQRLLEENKDYKNPEAAVANKIYKDTFEGTILKQKEEKALRKRKENLSVEEEVEAYFEEEKKAEEKKQALKIKEEEEHRKKELAYEKNWYKAEEIKRKEDDNKKKEEEKNALLDAFKKDKRKQDNARATSTITKAILAVVLIAADILRRILTATLDNAAKIDRETVESNNIGMSYIDRRSSDIFDIAHGMEKGSTFKALQSIQNSFGDVTNLDEKALGTLARVMGNEVAELVNSGMGGEDPERLLERIMNAYYKNWQEGKNSLGQYVGQSEARRELITSLGKTMPEIANLLGRMIDDSSSGKYGKEIQDYQSWRNTTQANRTGLLDSETEFASQLGTKYNEILAIVEDLKTSFFTRLVNSMDDLLNKLEDTRIGMTDTNYLDTDSKNREINNKTIEVARQTLESDKTKVNNAIKRYNDVISVPVYEKYKYNEEEAKNWKFTDEMMYKALNGTLDHAYIKSLPEEERKRLGIKNLEYDYLEGYRSRIYHVAVAMSKDNPEFLYNALLFQALEQAEAENKKDVGEGINAIDITSGEIAAKATEMAGSINTQDYNMPYNALSITDKNYYKRGAIEYFKNNPDKANAIADNIRTGKKGWKDFQRAFNVAKSNFMETNPKSEVTDFDILATLISQNDSFMEFFTSNKNTSINPEALSRFVNKFAIDELKERTNSDLARVETELNTMYNKDIAPGNYIAEGYTNKNGTVTINLKLLKEDGTLYNAYTFDMGTKDIQNFTANATVNSDGFVNFNASGE